MYKSNALQMSTSSLINDTSRIINFLDGKMMTLIFFPNIMEADVDHHTYFKNYNEVKNYNALIPATTENKMLKDKFDELPLLSSADFEYHSTKLPGFLLFLFIPAGILAWTSAYIKLAALKNTLMEIERKLNTLHFLAKSYSEIPA